MKELNLLFFIACCAFMVVISMSCRDYKNSSRDEKQIVRHSCIVQTWQNKTVGLNMTDELYYEKLDCLPWNLGETIVCWQHNKTKKVFSSFKSRARGDKTFIWFYFACFMAIIVTWVSCGIYHRQKRLCRSENYQSF